MKKIIFLLVLLLIPLAAAQAFDASDIKVTLLSQSPDPVEPGDVVEVKFKVESTKFNTQDDVIITFLPQHPFEIYSGSSQINLGKLRVSSSGADAAVATFKIKVSSDAVEQETELELELDLGQHGKRRYTNEEFMIDIQTTDATLDILSVDISEQPLPPGETADISVSLKNLADSLIKDISLELDFSSDDLPLAPYKSSSTRIIPLLDKNMQRSISFGILADPDATPGLHKIPITLTYKDERGNEVTTTDVLAVLVGETPKVRPFIKSSSVLQAGNAGKVTLSLANAGTTDVRFLELFIEPSADFQLVSTTNYYYIGDIDADDTESEELEIFINPEAQSLTIPVKIKYHDANNQPFTQQYNLEMNLYSESDLKKFGKIESSNASIYIIILIIAGLGFWWWRRKKKQIKK